MSEALSAARKRGKQSFTFQTFFCKCVKTAGKGCSVHARPVSGAAAVPLKSSIKSEDVVCARKKNLLRCKNKKKPKVSVIMGRQRGGIMTKHNNVI